MKTFGIIALTTTVVVLILNFAIKNPKFNDPIQEIEYNQKTDNLIKADKLYSDILSKKKLDLDFNYEYIKNHFRIPETTRIGKYHTVNRNDTTIFNYYSHLINSKDSTEREIGYYFTGLCYSCKNDYSLANENFKFVKNQNLKYLNNSLGFIYKRSNSQKAITHFNKEIQNGGYLEGAVDNLSDVYLKEKDAQSFELLMKNESTKKFVSLSKQRKFYFLKLNFKQYCFILWKEFLQSIDKFGFFAALLIAFIWLLYLRFLDIFETEKFRDIALVFVGSVLFSWVTFFLYDLFNISFQFDLTGEWLNDLGYCVFGIGLIEETIKLIPFILFLRLSRSVNEPIDYVIYACVAAIGFAFIENIEYFQNSSYHMIHGRALSAAVSHMCDSSIVAYGFIISKYKSKSSSMLPIILSLFTAAVVHGIYDFWLISEPVKDFSIFSILVLISSIYIWNSIKNNALNNSPFFDKKKKFESDKISKYLLFALSTVFILEYIIITFNYGPSAGNKSMIKSIWTGSFLVIALSFGLDQFQLKSGVWNKIKIWEIDNKDVSI
jgi:RsiW-degrading membrane proteinase PrsW (M82 family)